MGSFNGLSRRQVLRGTLAGSAVTLGLPILECALNVNGTAFANGAPLPVRFITWFSGLGCNPGQWEPKQPGALAGQPLGRELASLEPIKDKVNVYTNMNVILEGRPNVGHQTGWHGQLMGMVPRSGQGLTLPTIDQIVADEIGKNTRFRSLVISTAGGPKAGMSWLAGGVQLPAETSSAELYARIFGPEFRDPNDPNFKPDPLLMARRSILSGLAEERAKVMRNVGSTDKARLDEYYTSLRQLEQQVQMQLEKPAAMEACSVPKQFEDTKDGTEIGTMLFNNKLMSELSAFALACDQTRVVAMSSTCIGIRSEGDPKTFHVHTHEDPTDTKLGYQLEVSKFATRKYEGLATTIKTLANFKEGDSTLLDRSLVYSTTDVGHAMIHSAENMPIITAGGAGGMMKTGIHVRGAGDACTRAGLTVLQALKMPMGKFGVDGNETSRPWTEVLA